MAGNLTKLTNLNLDRNRLEFLPTEIGNLVNLGVLSLRENRLLELPAEIGNCRELHVLDVCGNKLQHLPFSLTSINLKVFTYLEVTSTFSFRNLGENSGSGKTFRIRTGQGSLVSVLMPYLFLKVFL